MLKFAKPNPPPQWMKDSVRGIGLIPNLIFGAYLNGSFHPSWSHAQWSPKWAPSSDLSVGHWIQGRIQQLAFFPLTLL